MADDLYAITSVWRGISDDGTYLDLTGGGYPLASTARWRLRDGATTTVNGVDLSGNEERLEGGSSFRIFGGSGTNTGDLYRFERPQRACPGTLEFFLDLRTTPTDSNRYLLDMSNSNNSNSNEQGFSIKLKANTRELQIQHPGTAGSFVDMGIFLAEANEHVFIQLNEYAFDDLPRHTLSIGIDGTATEFTLPNALYPRDFALGHSDSTSATNEGLDCLIKDIRYTHFKTRYPASGAYTVPTAPYDIGDPGQLTITDDAADYLGPAAVLPPDNAEPAPVVITRTASASGGTGPYTYEWFEERRGPAKDGLTNTLSINVAQLFHWIDHDFYCLVTDTGTGVVSLSGKSDIGIDWNEPAEETKGAVWVTDTEAAAGDTPTVESTWYGWGGDYEPVPNQADWPSTVFITWEILSGSATGNESFDGLEFTFDEIAAEDDGSVIKVRQTIGSEVQVRGEGQFTLTVGASVPLCDFDDSDAGFWRTQVNTCEDATAYVDPYAKPTGTGYSDGIQEAREWADGKTLGEINTEINATLLLLLDAENRIPRDIGYYIQLSVEANGGEPPGFTYDQIYNEISAGQVWGFAIFENDAGLGLPDRLYQFPEYDDFTRWYNIGYRASWEGYNAAVYDLGAGNPDGTSKKYEESLKVSEFDTRKYDYYVEIYDAVYSAVFGP